MPESPKNESTEPSPDQSAETSPKRSNESTKSPPEKAAKPPPAPPAEPPPERAPKSPPKYVLVNKTLEAEQAVDLVARRNLLKPTSTFGTIAYVIKGALGSGILASHVGFSKAGLVAIPLTMFMGIYMCYCLSMLVRAAQVIYKRTDIMSLSYSEVGEAALSISTSPKIRRLSSPFRYFIDFCVMLDLFGACCCYQLMISGTIKQIVEGTQKTSFEGLTKNHPNLDKYMLMILIPMILLCLLRELSWIAKISIVGNFLVLGCILTTVYYSMKVNPSMAGMKTFTNFNGVFTFTGLTVFSMSCCGIVVSLETNMANPKYFTLALGIGMVFIVGGVITIATFGYSAYGEDAVAPVTFHFPMTPYAIALKAGIALMLYITHAANFWVPFNLLFHYLKKMHKSRLLMWEYIYRVICVILICLLGVVFPSVNKLMSFLGAFCLSNMAFIFPILIHLAVIWERPGLGIFRWQLVLAVILVVIGLVLFVAGSYVSAGNLIAIFGAGSKIDEIEHHG